MGGVDTLARCVVVPKFHFRAFYFPGFVKFYEYNYCSRFGGEAMLAGVFRLLIHIVRRSLVAEDLPQLQVHICVTDRYFWAIS